MIVVCYRASGIKFVALKDVDRKGFWDFYRRKKKAIQAEDPDGDYLYISSGFPRMEFEVSNERRADGCDQYVARPNDWPVTSGEPL